jgi:hypothetical protein
MADRMLVDIPAPPRCLVRHLTEEPQNGSKSTDPHIHVVEEALDHGFLDQDPALLDQPRVSKQVQEDLQVSGVQQVQRGDSRRLSRVPLYRCQAFKTLVGIESYLFLFRSNRKSSACHSSRAPSAKLQQVTYSGLYGSGNESGPRFAFNPAERSIPDYLSHPACSVTAMDLLPKSVRFLCFGKNQNFGLNGATQVGRIE